MIEIHFVFHSAPSEVPIDHISHNDTVRQVGLTPDLNGVGRCRALSIIDKTRNVGYFPQQDLTPSDLKTIQISQGQ